MRQGQNPNREAKVTVPPLIMAAIVHLPTLDGYHAARLEVVQECLCSMRENSGTPAPVLVWDNGSCDVMRDWLAECYKPDFHIRSANVGKSNARKAIFRMFPPDTVIAITDDDMLFAPDWLYKQLIVLKAFPNVGTVSGYPVRTQFRFANTYTKLWAEQYAALEYGRFLPDQWEQDFAASIGRDWEDHKERTKHDLDARITYQGNQVYATSHHCQFIGYAWMEHYMDYSSEAMANERKFERAVDGAGLLRLCTTERLVRHIGNVKER